MRSTEERETEREVEQLLDSSTPPTVVRMASDSSLVVLRQEERLRNQESKDMFADTPLKHMDGNVIDCIGKEISKEECVEKSIEEGEDCFQDLSDNEEFGCDLMEDAVSTPSHLHVQGTEKY